MKNILIWETYAVIGGGQKVGLNILDALRDNYRCIFFVPGKGPLTKELDDRNIDYKILPLGSYSDGKKGLKDIINMLCYFPRVFKEAYQYIRKNDISLVYSNSSRSFIWSSLIGTFLSIPVIWHVHNFFEDRKTRVFLNLLGRLRSIKKLIFVSNAVRQQFSSLEYKSAVIYNGFTANNITKQSSSPDIRGQFSISPSTKIISIIAWISRPKKLEIYIRSIPHILAKCKDVHFLIVGQAKEGHNDYYLYLKKLTSELGIESSITFYGHCNDLSSLLCNIYVNCITSLETYSLVIPEAYASGVPVIVPDVGGPPELVKDGETGLIYEFGNEIDLADKISLLLKDADLHRSLSQNCRDYVHEFDMNKFNERVKTVVYQTLQVS